jgi:hypothetical protein
LLEKKKQAVFSCSGYQSEGIPDENDTHCSLWHELRNLPGFSPGEKQVLRVLVTRKKMQQKLCHFCLYNGPGQVPSQLH